MRLKISKKINYNMTAAVETSMDSMNMIRESARDFAEAYIRPNVMEWDESQYFPKDLSFWIFLA